MRWNESNAPEIPFQRPVLPPVPAVSRYFARAEEARWYSNEGPCQTELAARLAEAVGGGRHAIPVANCTLGLMIALAALTSGRRAEQREVLVPSFTFAATAGAVRWAGLEPVFVDVAPEHWSVDEQALAAALKARGDRVAAVLAATTFGTPPPARTTDAWARLAAEAGVPLIVDSAAGFGAIDDQGTPAGRLGHAEVFSFHATKPFAIGEGGLVTVRDAGAAEQIRQLANFGFGADRSAHAPGLNAKLAEWPAATGLAVLDGFDEILAARREAALAICGGLRDAGLTFQGGPDLRAWQFVPALAPTPEARDAIVRTARDGGVELRTYFDPPLHRMPAFADAARADALAVTDDLAARSLSLPLASDLSSAEIARIVATVGRSAALAVGA